ncbi:aminoglycoside phosphotransferase family protein [Solwaraspora sp. WMMD791]|uniref:phosphotransferase family protein n=1 Tax=Solwaraspora sp. WMMD791 TaxID=3016086 RepID=UPI00249BB635|nr:aminoglycoside phosphotransferase family protein [Solwaraspora sp. WMMD791]WFE26186.1 aminoglycoside phosphotransferase family protein [Solwaraspora sp. WMMD791]
MIGSDSYTAARAALAKAEPAADRAGLTLLCGGADNRLYSATTAHGPVMIKLRRHQAARYNVAAWASATLAAAGVPVPRILWFDQHSCVETRCPGLPLADPAGDVNLAAADTAVARQAGRLLRRVHATAVDGFGQLDADGHGRHPSMRSWLLGGRTCAIPSRIAGVSLPALEARTHHALIQHARNCDGVAARLVHGDWAARHVIADAGRVTGLVDLESVRGADPLTDLAGWSLQEPPELTTALFDGYFDQPPSLQIRYRLTVYRLRIATSLLHWHAHQGNPQTVRLRAAQLAADLDDLDHGAPRAIPRLAI